MLMAGSTWLLWLLWFLLCYVVFIVMFIVMFVVGCGLAVLLWCNNNNNNNVVVRAVVVLSRPEVTSSRRLKNDNGTFPTATTYISNHRSKNWTMFVSTFFTRTYLIKSANKTGNECDEEKEEK